MSCNSDNPCFDPCSQPADCYDNCGCTVEATFNCVTYTGLSLAPLGVANNDKGDVVLTKISDKILELQEAKGKLFADSSDTALGYLFDKIEPGLNMAIEVVEVDGVKKVKLNASQGGVPVDVNAKVSALDTTSGYLYDKITGKYIKKTKKNPGANEQLQLEVDLAAMISSDVDNTLGLGVDGKLKSTGGSSETVHIVDGQGTTVTGTGSDTDPFMVDVTGFVVNARTCFDGKWKDLALVPSSTASVVFVSGTPKYRIRFDGTIEFKGTATYKVSFGPYSGSTRKFTIAAANVATGCLSITEQAGTQDLKSMAYIDVPQSATDQIAQQYGYIIRKVNEKIVLEFQSAFSNATEKTIIVSFDGCQSHPSI